MCKGLYKGMRLFATLFLVLFLPCCSNGGGRQDRDSETTDSTQAAYEETSVPQGRSDMVKVNGRTYKFKYDFCKLDSTVTNSQDCVYDDYKVTLTISEGGSGGNDGGDRQMFMCGFTKNTFKSHVPERFFKISGLVGFCYNYESEDRHALHFIATVGDPDETLGLVYPLDVSISTDGSMRIERLRDFENIPVRETPSIDPTDDDKI